MNGDLAWSYIGCIYAVFELGALSTVLGGRRQALMDHQSWCWHQRLPVNRFTALAIHATRAAHAWSPLCGITHAAAVAACQCMPGRGGENFTEGDRGMGPILPILRVQHDSCCMSPLPAVTIGSCSAHLCVSCLSSADCVAWHRGPWRLFLWPLATHALHSSVSASMNRAAGLRGGFFTTAS